MTDYRWIVLAVVCALLFLPCRAGQAAQEDNAAVSTADAETAADETAAGESAPVEPTTAEATITVKPQQWGVSTRYIGGTEGDSRFDIEELKDCGINTLRIYGDMSRFEPSDDDGTYGSPSISEIEAPIPTSSRGNAGTRSWIPPTLLTCPISPGAASSNTSPAPA